MKKLLVFGMLVATSAAAFAAADDALISFSTKGPDRYADGTEVKDGECYALVWVANGAKFAGITADGKAVDPENNSIEFFASLAKGGRCPKTLFEAPRKDGGSFGVCLVDTRLASGEIGGINANGLPVAVNGYSLIGGGDNAANGGAATVAVQSADPTGAPKPQITSIKLEGDNVVLTVKNTLPCMQYVAKEQESLNGEASVSDAMQGKGSTDEEIKVIMPKKGSSGFYSFGRK